MRSVHHSTIYSADPRFALKALKPCSWTMLTVCKLSSQLIEKKEESPSNDYHDM